MYLATVTLVCTAFPHVFCTVSASIPPNNYYWSSCWLTTCRNAALTAEFSLVIESPLLCPHLIEKVYRFG